MIAQSKVTCLNRLFIDISAGYAEHLWTICARLSLHVMPEQTFLIFRSKRLGRSHMSLYIVVAKLLNSTILRPVTDE